MSWNQITFFVKFWVLIQDENEHHQKKNQNNILFSIILTVPHILSFLIQSCDRIDWQRLKFHNIKSWILNTQIS